MKSNRNNVYAFLFLGLPLLLLNCNEPKKDNIFTQLEVRGKINTFSLKVIVSEKFSGTALPKDLQSLFTLSRNDCKTLPEVSILRLGQNIFYSYNSFSQLELPILIENDEATITKMVDQQVINYLSERMPQSYDSLLIPNDPGWDIKLLALSYINNTKDSVFFLSTLAGSPAIIEAGNKSYHVYNNTNELRKLIDKLICKGQVSVSVFYNSSTLFNIVPNTISKFEKQSKGVPAGDTCIGNSKYQKLYDGNNSFVVGRLIEANSPDCKQNVSISSIIKEREIRTSRHITSSAQQGNNNNLIKEKPNAGNNSSRCASKSEPLCEKDNIGNYTGRRVQFCYNINGDIIRTLVVSKCDSDCRCF